MRVLATLNQEIRGTPYGHPCHRIASCRDLTHGMYLVDAEVTTQREYPNCGFWKEYGVVPQYGKLH